MFLSPEWMDAARAIRDEIPSPTNESLQTIRMNQVITDAPFNNGSAIHIHLDSTGRKFTVDEGHVDDPDVTITVDWLTARTLIVEQDTQAAMFAFMNGKVDVQGDLLKVIAILSETPDAAAREIAARIKDITAED